MLSVEENRRKSRKRYIAAFILSLFVICAVGIVVGYFIGRSVKACDKSQADTSSFSGPNQGKFHEQAVEEVSTEKLRNYLE